MRQCDEEITEETLQENLARAKRRLEALNKIEFKLREMRMLAEYAASRNLNEREAARLQEWMDILYAEVVAIDMKTGQVGMDFRPLTNFLQ